MLNTVQMSFIFSLPITRPCFCLIENEKKAQKHPRNFHRITQSVCVWDLELHPTLFDSENHVLSLM